MKHQDSRLPSALPVAAPILATQTRQDGGGHRRRQTLVLGVTPVIAPAAPVALEPLGLLAVGPDLERSTIY
jgi:hypothetical protein